MFYLRACFTHSLQQLALHEGLDHVVGGGEVPGLVDEVDSLETGREGVLIHRHTHKRNRGSICYRSHHHYDHK